MAARLKEKYVNDIIPELKGKFGYNNIMQLPEMEKITVNMGVGDAISDPRMIDNAMTELATITGQKASVRTARKSISNFKLRGGVKIGCMVTLRGARMYEFMDRLLNVAIPRIRDFRGVSPKSFDKFGNFTLGLREQTLFPEIKMDNVTRVRGMNVTFVIKNSASTEESRELLKKFGMPFSN